MLKPFIRLFSFFAKEIHEVRRQPRLVLSLLLGPTLILLLFGIGYQSNLPVLRTAIVVPPETAAELDPSAIQNASVNFQIVSLGADEEAAMELLRRNEVDVVQSFPDDIRGRMLEGEQTSVEFTYAEIDPLTEQWIRYLAYAEVVELNRVILLESVGAMQAEAQRTQGELASLREQLEGLEAGLGNADLPRLQTSIRNLRAASGALAVGTLAGGGQTRDDLVQLQQDLDALDAAISSGSLAEQQELIRSTRERVERLETTTGTLSALPPQVVVSPMREESTNLNGATYNLMTFYAPGVVALLLQHIGVTLGALALVRERLLGATELFRVAPINPLYVLLGKYLGYTVFIFLIALVLVGLLRLLGIPFLGSPLQFVELTLLLIAASLGVGFFISAISNSDSQAIQWSMLVLLLSIFFSGFFLALENFWAPVRAVSLALPITHGITGFQALMLRGQSPTILAWAALGVIAAVTMLAALLLSRFWYRRA